MLEDYVARLGNVAIDLSKFTPPPMIKRGLLACINDYTEQIKYPELGAGPDNDGYNMLDIAKQMGYETYFIRNPKMQVFLKLLDAFLKATTEHLVIFYVGHGTNVKDLNGDEIDGLDEAMVFDDGFLVDDILIEHVVNYKNHDAYLTLLTDACHSGTIWDLQSEHKHLPKNVISISAVSDNQTAKQTLINKIDEGIFTNKFRAIIKDNPLTNPLELHKLMRDDLKRYQQNVMIATTSTELLERPIFFLIKNEH
jgi:hypothetical protein